MSPEENLKKLIEQWLRKADDDFFLVEHLISEEEPFLIPIAFHAQQAVEKYLKAFLTYRQIYFPKTHDIGELLKLIATINPSLSEDLRDADDLTDYGVEIRYPADFPDLTIEEAKQAVNLARKVRDAILKLLPSK